MKIKSFITNFGFMFSLLCGMAACVAIGVTFYQMYGLLIGASSGLLSAAFIGLVAYWIAR